MDDKAEAFWTWTLAFYAGPGLSPALLHLQDRNGADVNIVLFLLWQATLGHQMLTPADCAALDGAVGGWRSEVVEPLRGLRRKLKGQGEDEVRGPIAAAELAAERSAQKRLVAALPNRPAAATPRREIAAGNLLAYAAFKQGAFDEAAVTTLLEALG
jgi:uncharacterized protein (TIGR02444 family)